MYNNEVINFTRVKLITRQCTNLMYQFNLLTMANPSLMDMTEEDAAEGSATIKNLYSHGFLDFRKHIACIYKK